MPSRSEQAAAKGTKACLTFENRPQTPDKVRKYRKSYFAEPGSRVTHRGMIDDAEGLRERLSNQRLGSRSSTSEGGVHDIFTRDVEPGSLSEFMEQRKEAIYKTNQLEPLGKPYVRGHDFSRLSLESKQARDETCAKELIYSVGQESKSSKEDEARVREQYKLSHNSFKPGEQRHRRYDWKGIDPDTHRFGVVDHSPANEGVGMCLQPDQLHDQARLTSVAVANHRAMTSDALGRPKYRGNVGSESIRRLEEQREQRKKSEAPAFTAQDCIEGDYTKEEQLPDADLGRSINAASRDVSLDRRFGCPTVRIDIKPPTTRSVSDNQNYGDDTNAAKLLYPSRFVAEGVDDSDFTDPSDREDIREVLGNVGYRYLDPDFDKLYRRTCLMATGSEDDHGQPAVSIKQFLAVVNERLRAHDEGCEPEWW